MFRTQTLRRNAIYAGLHVLHWIAACTVLSYASVYLLSRSFTNAEIGFILSFGNILGFVLQPVVAAWTDKTKRISPTGMIALLCGVSAGFSLISTLAPDRSPALVVSFGLLFAAIQVILPLVNAYAVYLEQPSVPVYYGIARGIGTAAYSLTSVVMGYLSAGGYVLALPVTTTLVLAATVAYMAIIGKNAVSSERSAANSRTKQASSFFSCCPPAFLFLLFGTAVLFFGHEIITYFFPQILAQIGAGTEEMGVLISLAAILEVPVLCLTGTIQKKISSVSMLKITAAATGLRILLFFLAPSVHLLYAAQALEIFTALFLVASINYANETIPAEHINQAQALLTAMVTASGIFASAAGGVLIDLISVSGTMAISVVVTIAGLALIFLGIKSNPNHAQQLP